jgi:hypothetical protein
MDCAEAFAEDLFDGPYCTRPYDEAHYTEGHSEVHSAQLEEAAPHAEADSARLHTPQHYEGTTQSKCDEAAARHYEGTAQSKWSLNSSSAALHLSDIGCAM